MPTGFSPKSISLGRGPVRTGERAGDPPLSTDPSVFSSAGGPPQPQPLRGPPQAPGGITLLLFENLAEAIGTASGALLTFGLLALQPLHPLLDQHLGHVADGAGFDVGQGGQAIAEILGQHHLNARRFGAPTR